MKVGMVQQSCTTDIPANIEKLKANIRRCAELGAQLVVLQELHNSVYFCQSEDAALCDLAEPIPGPSTKTYGALAKELGIVIVLSLFERRTAGIYHNTAVVIEKDGSIAGKYRKMHIPDDPCYYEKFYFTPGDLGFKPVETTVGTSYTSEKIGVKAERDCYSISLDKADSSTAVRFITVICPVTSSSDLPEISASYKSASSIEVTVNGIKYILN
ncbi:MAG: nitrilase-related carbon-nitrogen hydrolase [Candidatus Cryptobacteroides sp.]